jgi:hypothetical protein
MFRTDEREPNECASCGARVLPAIDLAFALTPDVEICFECSVELGGEYDEESDRWIVAPRTDQLPGVRDQRW